MSLSVNKVILIGNLGKDPEIKQAADGSRVVHLSVATSEQWKDKASGQKKDRTEWHRVVIFNDRLAEIVEKYLKKGSRVYIDGRLQTRKWEDNAGIERYSTEVVISKFKGELILLDGKQGEKEPILPGFDEPSYESYKSNASNGVSFSEILDDEIPF